MVKIIFSTPLALYAALEKAQETDPEGEVVVTSFLPCFNPHDALGAHDVLSYFHEMNVTFRFASVLTPLDLCIMSALPVEKRLVSKNSRLYNTTFQSFSNGAYKDLTIAAAAHEALMDRVYGNVIAAYNVDKERIVELATYGKLITGEELLDFGLTPWTEGV